MDTEPRPSLRRQLIALLVVPLAFVLVLSALLAYKLAHDFVNDAYDRALFDSATDLTRRLHLKDGNLVADIPPAIIEMLENNEVDRVYYEVRSSSGMSIVGHPGLPTPDTAAAKRSRFYYGIYNGDYLRMVAVHTPYNADDDDQRMATVIVGETLETRQALAKEILAAVALSQLLLIGLVSLAVYFGVGYGLRPLDRLREQIGNRSHRDLTPLDELQAPDEVRPLIHATNELMRRLQGAIAAQQRFIADAAHQLRTPLAGLKTHAELALREHTLKGTRERIDALVQATDRSARLAHQLLALARAEPETATAIEMRRECLATIAREVTAEWVPRALERNMDLGFSPATGPVYVRGNAVLLREMLSNLLDNAIRYGRASGHVTVRLEMGPTGPALIVEDDGPGIPPQDRMRVFERFSRLNDSVPEGCGLGLAIVREIVQTHGATIELTEGPNGTGAQFMIRFPRIAALELAPAPDRQMVEPARERANGPARINTG